MPTITYCMIGANKLHEIEGYIETILPYIDRFIFIDGGPDGGSTDGTIEYLESFGSRIEVYIHKWQDNFSNYRNNYLRYFTDKQDSGWFLISDTDEHFPISTISKLKDEIIQAESEYYNGIKIRAYDIITDDSNSNKIVSEKISNFYKPLLFKYSPDIYYEGAVHETLKGHIIWKQIELIYLHTRSQRKIYERAVQNFWIFGNNSQKWKEFKLLCENNNLLTFKDFFKKYKEGRLPKNIEDWIYNIYINYNGTSCLDDLEVRDMAILYYEILHPNRKVLNFKNEN